MEGSAAPCFAVWSLIVEARRRAGLTQTELALLAGTTQSTISAYEQARKLPTIPVLAAIIDACGLELSVGFTEPNPQLEALREAALARSVEERIRGNDSACLLAHHLRSAMQNG